MARIKITPSGESGPVDVTIDWTQSLVDWTQSLDKIAVAQRFLRLEPAEVFYAPLDGSRIDYHPCGREQDHPAYIDPETGQPCRQPEAGRRRDIEYNFKPWPHLCGRCGLRFFGGDAHGQYILHRCQPPVDWSNVSFDAVPAQV